jgi:hypothetical protein
VKHAHSGVLRGFPTDELHVECRAARCRRYAKRCRRADEGPFIVPILGRGREAALARRHHVTDSALGPSVRTERAGVAPRERRRRGGGARLPQRDVGLAGAMPGRHQHERRSSTTPAT